MVGVRRQLALTDTAQQAVGGFLLAGPFAAIEEVWVFAWSMSSAQALLTLIIVLAVGYDALYKTDDRDPDREREAGGIPVRFIPLISVSYLSVFILALMSDVSGTSLSGVSGEVLVSVPGHELDLAVLRIALKATSVSAVFSVIGAATTDSLF